MKLVKSVFFSALAAIAIASCESDSPENDVSLLSENARHYLSMKMGSGYSANSLDAGLGRGNPINESYQRLYSNISATSGRMKDDTVRKEDSTIYVEPWVTCAVITNTDNGDGSTTTVVDYGDGCEEGIDPWKYFMHGRYEYTYRNSFVEDGTTWRDSYLYDSKSVNYGGSYHYEDEDVTWLSNGTSSYAGFSEYNTATNEYSGTYDYSADETFSYGAVTYRNEGFAKSTYSNLQSVLEESDFKYTTGEDYYQNIAITPLVTRFDCRSVAYDDAAEGYTNDSSVSQDATMCYYVPYTSGIELIKYKQGNDEGSFQIDYGNGECDMEITIIEGGQRTTINLTETNPILLEK
jgi:hypothetical protein